MDYEERKRKFQEFMQGLSKIPLSEEERKRYRSIALHLNSLEHSVENKAHADILQHTIKPVLRWRRSINDFAFSDEKTDDKLFYISPWCTSGEGITGLCSECKCPVLAQNLIKIAEYICYLHSTFTNILCLNAKEILSQIPEHYDLNKICAFELQYASLNMGEIYNNVLKCHISKVLLYAQMPQYI